VSDLAGLRALGPLGCGFTEDRERQFILVQEVVSEKLRKSPRHSMYVASRSMQSCDVAARDYGYTRVVTVNCGDGTFSGQTDGIEHAN
jgi:hypothetical protein